MTPADIAKLVANGLIAVALVAFVVFGHMPWQQALVALAVLLVPSAAPTIVNLIRTAAKPADDTERTP